MTTATDKHLQRWGSATYKRVETEREIPKLKLRFKHLFLEGRKMILDIE